MHADGPPALRWSPWSPCFACLALLLLLSLLEWQNSGEDLPGWLLYLIGLSGSLNEVLHIGYQGVEAAPMHQGYFSHDTIVPGQTHRTRREKNLGSFLAGEVWRLGRNLSVLELGCGNGQTSHSLNTVPGVSCLGLDGYKAIAALGSHYQQWDLTTFFPADVDFTISFEVGEHIPFKSENEFIRTLAQAKEGIVLAWASPGQAGHGHVNNHFQSYLIRKLEAWDFRYCVALSHHLAQGYIRGLKALWEYRNLMVFVKKDSDHVCSSPLRELAVFLCVALGIVGLALIVLLRGPLVRLFAVDLGRSGPCLPFTRGKVSTV